MAAVDRELEEAVASFIDAFETVFHRDWRYTQGMLLPFNSLGSSVATFLEPGVEDECEDWGNRGYLLESYRRVRRLLNERGINSRPRQLPERGFGSHMRITNDYYLIVDLEATCSDDGAVPRHEMEIIEIGALMQSSRTFEIESEFQTFVRPVRRPELTEFCTKLTGITQANVASAPAFPEALEGVKEWMYAFRDALFCSWGEYDRKQFLQDCEFHQVAYPFRSGHLNLKAEFARALGRKKKLGIAEAVRHLGMEFEGAHHRGLDDARNIARIVRRICIGA